MSEAQTSLLEVADIIKELKTIAQGKMKNPNNILFDFSNEEKEFIKQFCITTKAFVQKSKEEKQPGLS